jgi:hypothetical protein
MRLAKRAKDVFELDRILYEPEPTIDSDGGLISKNLSGHAMSVIRLLAEELLPTPKAMQEDEWRALSAQEKIEHVRLQVRLSRGPHNYNCFSDSDLRFIAEKIHTSDFQLLTHRDTVVLNTIQRFAKAAIALLASNPAPVFFAFNEKMVVVQRNEPSNQIPTVDEIVSNYMSK